MQKNLRPDRSYVTCPTCSAVMRSSRFPGHAKRVHGMVVNSQKGVNGASASAKWEQRVKMTSAARRAALKLEGYVKALVAAPQKCKSESCPNQVVRPEEYCEGCKLKNIRPGTDLLEARSGCTVCGGPTLPGEIYCLACLGD